jgi:hypothetical protein
MSKQTERISFGTDIGLIVRDVWEDEMHPDRSDKIDHVAEQIKGWGWPCTYSDEFEELPEKQREFFERSLAEVAAIAAYDQHQYDLDPWE